MRKPVSKPPTGSVATAGFDWEAIDTVCLDMDGTVLDLHFDNHFWLDYLPRIYARKNALSVADAKRQLFTRFDAAKGQLKWYCLDFWGRELGLNIVQHKRAIAHRIALRPGALEFIRWVPRQRKKLYLITNAHPDSLKLKISVTNIGQYFDQVISAHQLGLAKEQPGFWPRLQQALPLTLSRTLFIDDSSSVLHAAKSAGLGHLLEIAQPDSQQQSRAAGRFPQLQRFSDIMNGPAGIYPGNETNP